MIFCIFSFNRGPFLSNCIRSVEHCLPGADIVVFDDDSDDPETLASLEAIREKYRVITPEAAQSTKHGGLYNNMQRAIEILSTEPLLCFLQDDTQLVRPVLERELAFIKQQFAEIPSRGFIQPCLVRAATVKSRPFQASDPSQPQLLYREDRGQSAGLHYSDLLITSPARLLERGWEFLASEPKNDEQAKALFGPMPYLLSPFAMWLPNVPTYRGKRKTWALRHAENRIQCGLYPYEIWSESQSENFVNRPTSELAIAERYLNCEGAAPPMPWRYTPLSGQRWLKYLNSAELFVHRHFGK